MSLKDYKIRLIIYNEWKRKTASINTAQIINSTMGNDAISEDKVSEWYQKFDKDNAEILPNDSGLCVSFLNLQGTSETLLDSLLFIIDDKKYFGTKLCIKDGRYFFKYCFTCDSNLIKEHLIYIYDLFYNTKGRNVVSFDISNTKTHIFGEYLFSCKQIGYLRNDIYKLHIFKVDYENLTIKELESIDIDCSCREIIPDRLDSLRFLFCDKNKTMIGQIQENDKLFMSDIGNSNVYRMNGTRLIGNLLQGFKCENRDGIQAMKFCEFNFGTMERTEKYVPFDFKNIWLFMSCFCWANDVFFELFKVNSCENKLFYFDLKTLKWSDAYISFAEPLTMFFDENDVMTVQVGKSNKSYAHYRISLRKPDTLMNLTWFYTLHMENIYGQGKYLNVAKQIKL